MILKNILALFLTLVFMGISDSLSAQTAGGRRKEHKNQGGGGFKLRFKKNKSGGHADSFAKGGGKKGFFGRLFKSKKNGEAWVYHKSVDPKTNETRLFSRNRTKNKRYRDGILARQNKQRTTSKKPNFYKRKRG